MLTPKYEKNPFVLTPAKKPNIYIERTEEEEIIIDDILSDNPSIQMYFIAGVRGYGKNVFVSNIEEKIKKHKGYITLNLSLSGDLFNEFAADLYEIPEMKKKLIKTKLDFSLLGVGLSVEKAETITDIRVAIRRMLDIFKKANRKVIICIDEVIKTEPMVNFYMFCQSLIKDEFPIYVFLIGLPRNILLLTRSETATSISRLPQCILNPLNFTLVKGKYKETFNISDKQSEEMAFLVKGYPYAFQLLGYLFWKKQQKVKEYNIESILNEYDRYLAERIYDYIWEELSGDQIKLLFNIIAYNDIQLLWKGICKPNEIDTYIKELQYYGLISYENDYLAFSLPRFKEYVKCKFVQISALYGFSIGYTPPKLIPNIDGSNSFVNDNGIPYIMHNKMVLITDALLQLSSFIGIEYPITETSYNTVEIKKNGTVKIVLWPIILNRKVEDKEFMAQGISKREIMEIHGRIIDQNFYNGHRPEKITAKIEYFTDILVNQSEKIYAKDRFFSGNITAVNKPIDVNIEDSYIYIFFDSESIIKTINICINSNIETWSSFKGRTITETTKEKMYNITLAST